MTIGYISLESKIKNNISVFNFISAKYYRKLSSEGKELIIDELNKTKIAIKYNIAPSTVSRILK
jgi:hypothetical protein